MATPPTLPPPTLPAGTLNTLLAARGRFLQFLRKRVGSDEAAEDILQSAFTRSLERGGVPGDDESAVAWFYRVLRNAVIDHYRSTAARSRMLEHFARDLQIHEAPHGELKHEVCGCVVEALQGLKPEYRDAIELVDVAEGSLRDLADRSGITAGNAAVRVHRARAALRKQVEAACGVCATHGCVDCRCGSAAPRMAGNAAG
jgi:RNA polymerase sigma-70 factor, ECF subfamily